MRAVKCPVSDVTASTASSQGQHKEDLLIYSQRYRNPSTTCRQDSFHLQTNGRVEELFPISYHWVPFPFITSHILLLWVFLSVYLSVLFCLCVGFAAHYSVLPLSHTQTHTVNTLFLHLCFLWQTQASTLTHLTQIHVFSNSFLWHWLVTLIIQADSFMGCS